MEKNEKTGYVLGIDYGTDSCRAVVIDAVDGREVTSFVAPYPRWAKGCYCAPAENRFRQHPLDYIETLETCLRGIASAADPSGRSILARVKGIAVDTTGSTPCAVTREGTPLALLPEFADDPDAMFILWKDHSSTAEAAAINELSVTWGGVDYTKYVGGIYSSEWFWAKIMHVLSCNPRVEKAAYSFIEHCDWMPALLTDCKDLSRMKRSRCTMGHKAMWHEEFGGYPCTEFLSRLHPALAAIRPTLGTQTWTSDQPAGTLTDEWADRLGLPAGIPVAVGALDAHVGAVGGGAREGALVKVMGTSTCDMIVGAKPSGEERLVAGICGQVDGSIIPGMLGYEAGQSAFGDVFAWFRSVLSWPLDAVLPSLGLLDAPTAEKVRAAMGGALLASLEREAADIEPGLSGLVAVDWLNGRRTPDANQLLKGAVTGLTLGTTAPMIYRALIEATAYGTKAIVERFRKEGVRVDKVVALGGVARKSPLVMQIVADVLGEPIDLVGSDQTVALGAAMFASVVAGIYPTVKDAQAVLAPPIDQTILPDKARSAVYARLYWEYLKLGEFIEKGTEREDQE